MRKMDVRCSQMWPRLCGERVGCSQEITVLRQVQGTEGERGTWAPITQKSRPFLPPPPNSICILARVARQNTGCPVKSVFQIITNILGFSGGSVVKDPPANAKDSGSIPDPRRSPGEGNGNSLQNSCQGNPWTEGPGGLQSMVLQKSWAQLRD